MQNSQNYPSRQARQFNIRLPPDLKEQVKRQADENERSMNSELVYLIKKGIEQSNDQTKTA